MDYLKYMHLAVAVRHLRTVPSLPLGSHALGRNLSTAAHNNDKLQIAYCAHTSGWREQEATIY